MTRQPLNCFVGLSDGIFLLLQRLWDNNGSKDFHSMVAEGKTNDQVRWA